MTCLIKSDDIVSERPGKPHCYFCMSFHVHTQYSIILKLHGVDD